MTYEETKTICSEVFKENTLSNQFSPDDERFIKALMNMAVITVLGKARQNISNIIQSDNLCDHLFKVRDDKFDHCQKCGLVKNKIV
jgi:hypothetical protein